MLERTFATFTKLLQACVMKTKTKGLDLRVGGSYASYLELVLLERTLATFTKLLQACVRKTNTERPNLRVGGSYTSYLEFAFRKLTYSPAECA